MFTFLSVKLEFRTGNAQCFVHLAHEFTVWEPKGKPGQNVGRAGMSSQGSRWQACAP